MSEQKPVDIGRVVQNAHVFNLKSWEDNVVREPAAGNVLRTVERFFTLLDEREIDYVLVGGVAMLQYVPGRNTEDLNLIVAPASLERLHELEITGRDANFARAKFEGLQIDLLLTSHGLFKKVQQEYAEKHPFRKREINCATVEGLILLKLFALPSLYRQGKFARVGIYENDVATLLQAYEPDLQHLFDELSRHLSATDLSEVQDIVADIRRRIERFDERR